MRQGLAGPRYRQPPPSANLKLKFHEGRHYTSYDQRDIKGYRALPARRQDDKQPGSNERSQCRVAGTNNITSLAEPQFDKSNERGPEQTDNDSIRDARDRSHE